MRRLLTGLLGASLLLGACSDDEGDGDRAAATSIPTDTTSSTTTTEPPVPPPDVIPSDPSLITEEYVEQVLDALFAVSHEALLLTMVDDRPTEEALALIGATTPEPAMADAVNELFTAAAEGFPGIRPDPQAMDTTVVKVLEVTPTCVLAEIAIDDSGLFTEPLEEPAARTFARLTTATEEQVRSGLNPTAWTIASLPVSMDGSEPEERC